jgi:CHAD domain-containing protein
LDLLIGIAHGRRAGAQKELEDAAQAADDLKTRIAEALDSVRPPEEMAEDAALQELAGPQLTAVLSEFEDAAGGDLTAYERLHQVRILGKRLRYAMELFEVCYAPAFRDELYPQVEEMQETLGLANDSHVAAGRLKEMAARLEKVQGLDWKRYQAGIEGLIRAHQRRLPRQRRLFEEWWRRWQESGGEAALAQMIKAPRHELAPASSGVPLVT